MRIVGRGQMPVDTGARERPDPIPPNGLQVVAIVVVGGLGCEFTRHYLHPTRLGWRRTREAPR